MSEFEGSPKTWPPLGLPVGSVRAILTLIVVGVVVSDLARGQELDVLWIETLLIALAHYFATRRFVSLPPDVLRRLEQEGVIDKESHPLFLPKHSIRTLIVGAFVGLTVYLYRDHRLFETRAASFLGIVFAYILGSWFRAVKGWFTRPRARAPSWIWRDAGAVIALALLLVVAIPEFIGFSEDTMPMFRELRKGALCVMLFYFGSR